MTLVNQAVALDPLSPWGYERKLTALYGLHRYDEAISALNEMLSRLRSSSDPQSCSKSFICSGRLLPIVSFSGLRQEGINPPQTATTISTYVTESLRHSPLVLIHTESGRLCDKSVRTHSFQACPKFKDLILSPPSQLDHETIKQTVTEYFRYTTLSHTWEEREPLFHDVLPVSVYDLPTSPTNTKLQQFCLTSRDAGFNWSWSDTCCVDKTDGPVLQESLTSMYQWYHESSLTLVHLKGVLSPPEVESDLDAFLDALVHCIWNTRAWTLQEYFASTVIRFYTQDWKPYLRDINISNDKSHPAVMRQMVLVTGVEAQVLGSLRPGPDNVREKLRLASNRIATRQEDTAYSLFGILGVSIPAIYGEGHKALGRLLEAVLYRSGDATILAWTGRASDHNSCLPAEITVYVEDLSFFVPSPIEHGQMVTMTSAVQLSSMHQESAIQLYDRVVHLPSPRLVSSRLSLSCIAFPITSPEDTSTCGGSTDSPARHYTAMASALGKVEIKTTDELAGLENLVLVHPWLDSLLDPIFTSPRPNDDANSHSGQPSKLTRALHLLIRLRQPFGALLLAPLNRREFKRIATDHLIRVQVRDDISIEELLGMVNVDVLDIL